MPGPYRVLVIEDDPRHAQIITDYLTANDSFTVDWVDRVNLLWDFLNAKTYHIILLDFHLPDGDGLAVLAEIEMRGYNTPVIMVTARGDQRIAVQAMQLGAADYIVKEGDYASLLPAIIRRTLEDHELKQSIQHSLEKIRYQALILKNMRDAVIVWDVEGRITYWNPVAEALFGWSVAERLGDHVSAGYFSMFLPRLEWPMHNLVEGDIERRTITKNGNTIWVSSRVTALWDEAGGGHLLGYMDVIRDITERKNAEEELKKLSSVVKQTAESVLITNNQGMIEYINPSFEKLSGYSKVDVIGAHLDSLRYNEESRCWKDIWKVVSLGHVYQSEFTNQKKNGELYFQEEIITPIYNSKGEINTLVLTGRDVTERRIMEAKIQGAQTRLVQAARLAAVGELASGIAHRIYNPLTTIIGDAQIMKRNLPPDHPEQESVEAIEKAGWAAQKVVQRLIEFSRPSINSPEWISLNQTIKNALALVGAQIQACGIQLAILLAENIPQVFGDASRLEDLWVTLLLEARDMIAEKGMQTIHIHSTYSPPGEVIIDIRMDGQVISRDRIPKMFDPDLSEPANGHGTGMELSICREIVRHHSGQISIDMDENSTLFRVILPANEVPNMEIS